MKNWKAVVVTFGIFFNISMYEALALGTNNLELSNTSNSLIILPYYGNMLNFSNVVNSSTISNFMIRGLTNFSQLINMTNSSAWKYDSEYIIKMLKRDGKLSEHIKELVKSGEVCQVIGHKWQAGCKEGWGCAVIHKEDIQHCAICLIEERRPIN